MASGFSIQDINKLLAKLTLLVVFLLFSSSTWAQLSGNYTINPVGTGSRNFKSISAAVYRLDSFGVSNEVNFLIADGTYSGQLSIGAIIGASRKQAITFKGASSDSSKVIIENGSAPSTVVLDSAQHIHFQHLTIQNTYSGSYYNVFLKSNADSNTFTSCVFKANVTGSFGYNVYVSKSEENVFKDCFFNGGYYGAYLNGWSNTKMANGNLIWYSTFKNQYYYGMFVYNNNATEIVGCEFDSLYNMKSGVPLYVYNSNNFIVSENKIWGGTYNVLLGFGNYYNSLPKDSSVLANNMLGGADQYGIYAYNLNNARFLNNSLSFNSTNQFGYGVYVYNAHGQEWFNNNLNINSSYFGLYLYGPKGFEPDYFRNNNLFINSSNTYAHFLTTTYSNFAALVGASSLFHQNTVNVNPDFVSDRNLSSYASDLNNNGINVGLVSDIFGNSRPNVNDKHFDIGCNEFYLASQDLDVIAVLNPLSVKSAGNKIKVRLKNRGADTITSSVVRLAYTVDSGKTSITQLDTITSLAPAAIYDFEFDQTWVPTSSGGFLIKAYILEQVSGDPDLKDEYELEVCSGLKGFYTVNANRTGTRNFKTLNAALFELKCGIDSHTVIDLAAGNYNQKVVLKDIYGLSSTSSLTIKGVNRDSVEINYTGRSFSDAATIEIEALSHLVIKDLSLVSGSNSFAQTIRMSNGCHWVKVENCKILCNNSTSAQSAGIAINSLENPFTGTTSSHISVVSNLIDGHNFAINCIGESGKANSCLANEIVGNSISYYNDFGINVRNADSVLISGNEMLSGRSSTGVGCRLETCFASTIAANNIVDYGKYGLLLLEENKSSTTVSKIENNMVGGNSSYSDIYEPSISVEIADNCNNILFWNNSIAFNSTNDPYYYTGALYVPAPIRLRDATNLDLRNNLFLNNSSSTKSVALVNYNSSYTKLDFNNYYSSKSNLLVFDGFGISSLSTWQNIKSALNARSFSQSVSFVSNKDLHLTKSSLGLRGDNLAMPADFDGDLRCSLAPTLGADESQYPTPKPRVFFAVNDTIFYNSPTTIYNGAGKNDAALHNWFIDGSYASSSLHLETKFNKVGTYSLKLISENCGGIDSFSKSVVVQLPKRKPQTSFIADRNQVSVNDLVAFTDLTTNGPDSFSWSISPYWYFDDVLKVNRRTFEYVNSTDSSSRNPIIEFLNPGEYDVCLNARNSKGQDKTCNSKYILVREKAIMCASGFKETKILSGNLFDPGGESANYSSSSAYKCSYLVDACAKDLYISFNLFELAGSDYLRIYDGDNNLAPALHSYNSNYRNGLSGSSKAAAFKDTLVAKSGKAYIEFETNNFTGAPGFDLVWSGTQGKGLPPVAKFSLPDTICKGINFNVNNQSTGRANKYQWYMGDALTLAYTDSSISHSYDKPGTYWIKLVAENCFGTSIDSQKVVAVRPWSAPSPNLSATTQRPKVGFPINLYDESSYSTFKCTDSWQWTFSPSSVVFVSGTSSNSQNPIVVFQDTGCYTVKLVVGNAFGKDSIEQVCYFQAIKLCEPSVAFLNTDLGISRVKIGDIDHSSKMADRSYNDYSLTYSTELQIGATYPIEIYRSGKAINSMNRAVWIDFNQDGIFNDSTEKVAFSGPDTKLGDTLSIFIPSALTGPTTLRVGVNISNKDNLGCGPNQFGEFEDYTVILSPDVEAPKIRFLLSAGEHEGNKEIQIEQCSNWSNPLAYGYDNVDDSLGISKISGRVKVNEVGKYVLTYESIDLSGNVGTATYTVNVFEDTTAVLVSLLGKAFDTIEVFSSYNDSGLTTIDNCTVNPFIKVSSSLDTSVLGTYFIDYSITDNTQNRTELRRSVTVVDITAPIIDSINGKDTVVIEVFDKYTELGINYSDQYYSSSMLKVNINGQVNTSATGDYLLTYTVRDSSGNISEPAKRLVKVVDTQKPVIGLIGGDTVEIDVFEKYYDWGLKSVDNYTRTSQLKTEIKGSFVKKFGLNKPVDKLGFFEYRYLVSDESGNMDSISRMIHVLDREEPRAILNGLPVIMVDRWSDYTDEGVTITDNYWQESGLWTKQSGEVNTQSVGTYYISYCPFDSSGNSGNCVVRYIIVEEPASISEKLRKGIEVYPNPASKSVVLYLKEGVEQPNNIMLYNSLGKLVKQVQTPVFNAQKTTVETADLASGMYLIKMTFGMSELYVPLTVSH